jgi:hypothetical protein
MYLGVVFLVIRTLIPYYFTLIANRLSLGTNRLVAIRPSI